MIIGSGGGDGGHESEACADGGGDDDGCRQFGVGLVGVVPSLNLF